ncbi:unnamed protein product [Cunninghamella blakesleeana]
MVSAIVFLADGSEEMEFTIIADVLRRAKVDVKVVGVQLQDTFALCSRGIKIVPNVLIENLENADSFDALIIPGGSKGAETLASDKTAQALIKSYYNANKIVSFICAGPLAAKSAGIAKGKSLTSYPAFKDQLSSFYEYKDERVVIDGNLITSRSPGTTFLFALTLVEKLVNQQVAEQLKKEMLTASHL